MTGSPTAGDRGYRPLTRRDFMGRAVGATLSLTLGAALAKARHPGHDAHTVVDGDGQDVPLPRRSLGRSGATVCALGLGGAGWLSSAGDRDRAEKLQLLDETTGATRALGSTREIDQVEELLHAALDAGIDFFDTYPGRAQENLGLVTRTSRRKDVFVASKITRHRTYDHAMRQFETSLNELGVDHIELLQIHHINAREDVAALAKPDGVLTAIRKLRDQKAVRYIGITGHPRYATVLECIERYDDLDTIMCFANPEPSARPSLDEQIPAARKKGMGIIAMKVFGGGTTAKLIGQEPQQSSAAKLLRYALSLDIDVAIPGVASMAELKENIAIVRAFSPMTDAERKQFEARWSEG